MSDQRLARRLALSIAGLFFGAWLTLFAASWIYTPGHRMTPPGRISPAADFTGQYCFTSATVNERRYSASDPAVIPFLRNLQDQSTVQVRQDSASISFTISSPAGIAHEQRYDFLAQGGRIENGVLVVTPFQGSSPFGWYRTRRKSTMYKLEDGSLVMTDQHTYTGVACALVPTHERSMVVLTLSPGACGADPTTR
jgi:hypothetical protein